MKTTVIKTFWLSFCDEDKPAGQQFLGVAIVEVTDEEAADALVDITIRFPNHAPDAEWVAAAMHKAHQLKCNPGGQMASVEIDPLHLPHLDGAPRHTLMQKDELQTRGLI